MTYKVHDLFQVEIQGPPENAKKFFNSELEHFRSTKKKGYSDLTVRYEEGVMPPGEAIALSASLLYSSGHLYLKKKREFIEYDISNWPKGPGRIRVSPKMSVWWVWYLIEKTMRMMAVEKGFVTLHASAAGQVDSVTLSVGSQGAGKTEFVLHEVAKGHKFLGDDLVLVDGKGSCLCYPKRINIKVGSARYSDARMFYNREFPSSLVSFASTRFRRSPDGEYLSRKSRLNRFLSGCTRNRQPEFLRMTIKELVPEAQVLNRGKISRLILLSDVPSVVQRGKYPERSILRFLWRDNFHETMSHLEEYIEAIARPPDKVLRGFISSNRHILKRQYHILREMLVKIPVLTINEYKDRT